MARRLPIRSSSRTLLRGINVGGRNKILMADLRACFEDDGVLANNLKKYVAAYSKGLPGSAAFRQHALETTDLGDLLDHTRRYFGAEECAA